MRYLLSVALVLALPLIAVCGQSRQTPTPLVSQVAGAEQPFFLEILSPASESVVRESSILVRGKTRADAVVSINGYLVEVNPNGSFEAIVPLGEGPNTIEVIASDFYGNQRSIMLSVIYVQ